MIFKLTKRMLLETDKRLLFKFAYNFGWKGIRAVQAFERRAKKGEQFPAFLFLSITNNCNLKCQGCWVTPSVPALELAPGEIENVIESCKRHGSYFFGIMGGEPLLYKGLFDIIAKHPECYFLIFTNGTLLTDEIAREMRRLGNVTPLVSVEGTADVSDIRRGGRDVYSHTMQALENCSRNRLVTGVATSVCKSNFRDLVSEKFVNELVAKKAHYIWYYIYRPVGGTPHPELTLDRSEILELRKFIVDIRMKAPIAIVDSYWDHLGRALCPAATGMGYHINPAGYVEFCPPIQYAKENISDANWPEAVKGSEFLAGFRKLASSTSRGCILLENPKLMAKFIVEQKALNTSGRCAGIEELESMGCCASHHQPGYEVPERHWAYRFAKKYWFFGFGAYG
ncbi:MAG: radical SAM/SPASM domain-containing protein [Victivallales bacterium]|jgi:MoaA/NifB/PqqE/SkfB family radical SAM enzyme